MLDILKKAAVHLDLKENEKTENFRGDGDF